MDNTELFAVALPALRQEEGLRLTAYQDTLGVWTIGYGHAYVAPGTVWTQEQADSTLVADATMAADGLDSALTWWRSMNIPRQAVLLDMCFNVGLAGLLEFHASLTAMQNANWYAASNDMLASLWAKQVPNRAKRLAEQMLTGVVAGAPQEPIVTDTGPVAAQPAPTPPVAPPGPSNVATTDPQPSPPAALVATTGPQTVVADINTLKPLIIAAAQEISSGPVTVSAILTDTKSIWSSKTFWGIAVAGVAAAAQQLGYNLTTGDQSDLINTVTSLIGSAGMLFALYGRIVATKAVK